MAEEEANREEQLVAAARAGDRLALEALVERHYGPIRALLVRYGSVTESDADDLVQETFLRVLSGLKRYRHQGHLRAWLLRIALNLAHDARRKTGRVVTGADVHLLAGVPEPDGDPAERLVESLEGEVLAGALARLPETQREALVLRFYADLPVQDIARVVGCPEGTVKSRIHYALRKLRGLLTQSKNEGVYCPGVPPAWRRGVKNG